ncbi:MAG: WXG100 family type VII secretion target [Lachnospiraceae bacterium]|nr:WXG100 family type VII secretion target [Lachnospiraceae bacterium]
MGMNASGVEIRVLPEVLNAKAQEVTAAITQMEHLFENVQTTVSRSKYYWIGEAGELHRKMFEEQKDDVAEILVRLKEHPVDLQKIAKTYTSTEQQLAEAASQMSSNLID